MTTLVIDASIAIKWIVEEPGTKEALALRQNSALVAPDLLVAECANVLWKKVEHRKLLAREALFAARLLRAVDIELVPTRSLLDETTRLAIELAHPAYDCLYLALALERRCCFVTTDERLLRKIRRVRSKQLRGAVLPLVAASSE